VLLRLLDEGSQRRKLLARLVQGVLTCQPAQLLQLLLQLLVLGLKLPLIHDHAHELRHLGVCVWSIRRHVRASAPWRGRGRGLLLPRDVCVHSHRT
jgi:hypothetical protein